MIWPFLIAPVCVLVLALHVASANPNNVDWNP